MNDELRAAAERINEAFNGGGISLAYPTHDSPSAALDAECSMLARAYLAEHPADDGEPVTVEWMESIGFVQTHSFAWEFCLNSRIRFHHDANITTVGIEGAWSRKNPRRGDVRQLFAALGIELKEPTA